MLPDSVVQKLEALPAQPGVYLFKDKKDVVVYVGKAKSLRSRVRSYFQDARGRRPRLHPGPAAHDRGPRDDRHGQREGSDDPREQPHQGVPAPLQRQAPGRQGLHHAQAWRVPRRRPPARGLRRPGCATARRRRGSRRTGARERREPAGRPSRTTKSGARRVAAARGRAAADAGRRALLRAVPLGDGRAAHAPPREQALPAPHVQRRRSSRAGGGRACSTRSSAARRRASSRSTAAGTASRSTPWRSSSRAATTSSRASSPTG